MTGIEASRILEGFIFNKIALSGEAKYVAKFTEACALGAEAIGKQIPKKPTHDGIRPTCPTCGNPLPNVAHNNCMYCGQSVAVWSEVEE